jgi:hypothetical protein
MYRLRQDRLGGGRISRIVWFGIAGVLWAACMAAPAEAQSELSEKVLALTGSRTKVVWIRGSRDAGGKLMCFDTSEGKERDVVPSMNKCQDPKLTPDASRILFNYPDKTSWIVNWDGSGLKQLFNGRFHYIQGVAKDPKTGVEWVYVSDVWSKEAVPELKERGWNGNAPNGTDFGLSIYRYRLDDLSGKELVWDKQYINQRVEIALDGSQIWGEIPHPHCAVAQVPNGSLKIYHKGCNGNLAPDRGSPPDCLLQQGRVAPRQYTAQRYARYRKESGAQGVAAALVHKQCPFFRGAVGGHSAARGHSHRQVQ